MRAWGHGVAGQPPKGEVLSSQMGTCSQSPPGYDPLPNRSICRVRRFKACGRAGRDPDEFLASWRVKTLADRERFWSTLRPEPDDDLLRQIAILAASGSSPTAVATSLSHLGENIVSTIVRRCRPQSGQASYSFLVRQTTFHRWEMKPRDWPCERRLCLSRSRCLGKCGISFSGPLRNREPRRFYGREISIPAMDAATIRRTLFEAGATGNAVSAVTANGADAALVDAAIAAVRATVVPPTNEMEDDRAHSAAERLLFEFLESLPETSGGSK